MRPYDETIGQQENILTRKRVRAHRQYYYNLFFYISGATMLSYFRVRMPSCRSVVLARYFVVLLSWRGAKTTWYKSTTILICIVCIILVWIMTRNRMSTQWLSILVFDWWFSDILKIFWFPKSKYLFIAEFTLFMYFRFHSWIDDIFIKSDTSVSY